MQAHDLEFRLLGPLEVRAAAGPVDIGGPKERALLAILLLHADEVVSTDRLIEDLWRGSPPAAAENVIQTYVSHLRRALEPDRSRQPRLLLTRRPGYVLAVAPDQLDLQRAERLSGQGERALAEGRPGTASRVLGQALSLWRGPPLAEFADETWAVGPLVRIDELRLATTEEATEARLALGRHGEVIAELQGAVATSPLRERLTGLLMLALYRCGRQAEALAAYRDLRLRLGEELGIEPSAEIARLEEAMVLQKPELDWRPRGAPQEAARPSGKLFVGRAAELSTVVAALDGAEQGRGQVALVGGEPGIGKTRLLEEATFIARSRGLLVLWGRCYQGDGSPPYWVWAHALRQLLDEAPAGSYAAELQVLLPEAELNMVTDNPDSARFRLFDGLVRFLAGIARRQPVVVVLDDLQWADPGSLLCLEHLGSEVGGLPIAILGTYRDTEVTPPLSAAVARIAREWGGQVLRLDGLGEAAVTSYLQETLGTSSPSAAASLVSRTSGNPLYIEQLVAGGDASASTDLASWARSVPTTLRDVIVERCRRLPSGTDAALATAAVIGTEFDLVVLERVLPDDGDLPDHLDAAVRAGILEEVGGRPGRYRFAHDLVREALVATWSELRATHLHRRIGEALEGGPMADRRSQTSELAHHFRLAARDGTGIDKAVDYCLAAARSATEALAYEDALAHAAAAVELADTVVEPASRLRCESRLALGEARWRGGEVGRARVTYLEAADAARAAGDARLLALAAVGFGGGFVRDWHATRGVFGDQVVVLLEEAIAGLGDDEPRLRARLLGQLAEELYYELDEGRRAHLSEEAVSLARFEGDTETLAACLASRCAAMWGPDGLDDRLADAAELILLAERLGNRELGMFARHYLFVAQLESGDTVAATATLDGFDVLTEEARLPLYRWEGRWFRALLALIAGRFGDAERLAGEALEIGTATGDPDALAIYGAQIAIVRLEQGRVAELYDSLVAFADEFAESPVWQAALCYVDTELGRLEDAKRSFARLAAGGFSGLPRNFGYLAALAMLATVCARLGDRARAAQLRGLLLPYAGRHILTADRHSWGSAALYLAMLETVLGQDEAADVRFRQAIEANERIGAWPWVAHSLREHASAIEGRDPVRARALAARADQLAGELGMERLRGPERGRQGSRLHPPGG